MQKNLVLEDIKDIFSPARLSRYLQDGDTFEQIIKKYHQDICLSEAFIPTLHYFEVCFRNRINGLFERLFGKEWLLRVPPELIISQEDLQKIEKLRLRFKKLRKKDPTHDDILSQMTFGFWFSFFHRKYDPIIWQKKGAIREIFPLLEKKNRKSSYIFNRIKAIKEIRNRIAHHEPVLNHRVSIDSAYSHCQELLKAMSPSAYELLKEIDRFPNVKTPKGVV